MAGNRKLPLDLLIVAGFVLITNIFILVPVLSDSFLRTCLGIFLVLFLPGYSLAGAIFPAKKDLEEIERAAIALGLSIAVVPIIGLSLNYSIWGISETPVLLGFSVFILLMCAVAYYRRRLLPEDEVFEISFKTYFLSMKTEILEKSESKIDKTITFILVLSILASMGSLAYIIGNPKEGEHFTEFYILGKNRTAENYPTEFIRGEEGTVFIGIINHEYRPVDYTMEVRLENQSLSLPESQKHVTLGHNMSWEEPINFTPPFEGENMKLEFLLFNETEKTEPYRNLHLWINVTQEV
ncbi:DUF1616 domain-containing protein [Methanosarcina sp. MSH10X1]|uniref:DUF1616 domain-containing protein n=1 Tax=Methanosarcina sp. MSH10X1 TaxID=2507075 RepID=UPI000FFC289E|nr:DUF1616 domain-containing protein [Methanosarcina sp. MSH10X1]RXA19804.1 DUF1616 domain-containing protein [Methanosarcina sp. MSH10X1]